MNESTTPEVVRGGVLAFDEFELDVPAFELRRAGVAVPMEPQVFEVLRFLVENAGAIVTKDEILDRVWPERYVTEAALNSRVMTARKALGDSGKEQKYIKTIHGRGYRFVAPVRDLVQAPARQIVAIPTATLRVAAPEPAAAATSFVGREAELVQLVELATGGSRLLSIIGPGGMGKTRMAMEMTGRLRAAKRRVFYVPLETLDDAGLVHAMAEAAGFKLAGDDPVAVLAAQLANADITFVLDNFEHLVAHGRGTLARLMDAAPGLRFVVTSRVVLGLRGEWVFRAGGLALQPGHDGISEAARLFLERERQADAGSGATPDMEAVDEICRLVGGMPLAIELAAALRRYLGYREIASLVANDLSVLSADLHDVPDRHRSIEALLEASCRHLSEAQQQVLCALGVFEGSFTADAAREVTGANLQVLRALVDASLVQPGNGRFSLHPLMRQLTRARDVERLDALAEAHAAYYARFLAARTEAFETAGQSVALKEVDAELTNVFAAWKWAASHGRLDLLAEARHVLFCHLTFRARYFDAQEMERVGIAAAEAAGTAGEQLLAGLLIHRVWTAFRMGLSAQALEALQRAATLTEKTGFIHSGIAMDPRVAIAALRVGTGEYQVAYESASAALKSARQREDQAATAFASWMAGVALFRTVELDWAPDADGVWVLSPGPSLNIPAPIDEAERLIEQAAAILEAADEKWLRGYVEIERGLIAGARGRQGDSCDHYRASYELRREIDDPQGMGSALIYLCDMLSGMGYLEEARELHAEARCLFKRVGDQIGMAEVDRGEGFRAVNERDYEVARQFFLDGMERSMSMNFANNVLGILRGIADLLHVNGHPELAGRCLNAIAWNPSATPFARTKSRGMLQKLGIPEDRTPLDQIALARLIDEAVRAFKGIETWVEQDKVAEYIRDPDAQRALAAVPELTERAEAVA